MQSNLHKHTRTHTRNRVASERSLPIVLHCLLLGLVIASVLILSRTGLAGLNDKSGDDETPQTIPTLPHERGGQESLGRAWPELDLVHVERDESSPREADANDPTITLYRWWANGCPFCRSSLPAIETWREQYEGEGLRTVAVYHPKPPRDVSKRDVQRAAEELGYHGELAIDADWSQFNRVTRNWEKRSATSVSFLVDHEGVIRFVHPGPDFFPSEDSQFRRQHEDHQRLEQAIKTLLKALPEPSSDELDAGTDSERSNDEAS